MNSGPAEDAEQHDGDRGIKRNGAPLHIEPKLIGHEVADHADDNRDDLRKHVIACQLDVGNNLPGVKRGVVNRDRGVNGRHVRAGSRGV